MTSYACPDVYVYLSLSLSLTHRYTLINFLSFLLSLFGLPFSSSFSGRFVSLFSLSICLHCVYLESILNGSVYLCIYLLSFFFLFFSFCRVLSELGWNIRRVRWTEWVKLGTNQDAKCEFLKYIKPFSSFFLNFFLKFFLNFFSFFFILLVLTKKQLNT